MRGVCTAIDGNEACASVVDPRRAAAGERPLVLDSPPPKTDLAMFMARESRFHAASQQNPDEHTALIARAKQQIARRLALYRELAAGRGV